MTKKLVMTLAVVGFVAACAKKNDDHSAVGATPQANTPVQSTTNPPGAKVPNTGNGEAGKQATPQGSKDQGSAQAAGASAKKAKAKKGAAPGFGEKEAILPAEANYEYTGTADDKLNMVLTSLSKGTTDAETEADNNLKAKQISGAKLLRGADGAITVVLDVPETTLTSSSSTEIAKRKKSASLVEDTSEASDVAQQSAQDIQQALGESTQVVRDELDLVVKKPAPTKTAQSAVKQQTKKETSSESKSNKQASKKHNKSIKHKDSEEALEPIKQQQIVLKGRMAKGQQAELFAANLLGKKLGAQALLKCLDANGDCDTSVLTLNFGDIRKEQKVQVIFRTSSFNYSVKFPDTQIHTILFKKFVGLFMNSRYANLPPDERNVLKLRQMESFEVINGRSGIKVTLQSLENEIMTFKFAGLKDDQQGGFNEAVDKQLTLEDGLTLAQGESFSTQLGQSISEARLVGNDGRGVFKLSLKMKELESSNDDTVDLTLIRTQNKIKY